MKKIYSFMLSAVAVLAAASCAQIEQNLPQEPAGETVTFTATTDATKTVLIDTDDVNKTEWVSGDKITIHNGTSGYEFTTADAGSRAVFSYVGTDFSGDKFIAVYPAGTYEADVEAKTVKANIPTYQASRSNTYNEGAALAVAYTESNSLAFKNASALLKFTVKGNNIKGVIFFGHNGEAVSGDVQVTLDAEGKIASVVPQETTITENDVTETKMITHAKIWAETENYCFAEETTYYLAVVPQTFDKGFTVQLEVDGVGNKDVKKLETSYELKPNTILNIGELEYVEPEVIDWAIAGTYNNWSAEPMAFEDGFYVARNVTGLNYTTPAEGTESTTGFKFIKKGDWKGSGEGNVTAGSWNYVWGADGKNIYVEGAVAETAYDVYINPNEGDFGKFVIVAAGEPMPEDKPAVEEEVVVDYWAVIGTMTDNWASEIQMALDGDWYVVENVKIMATDQFKFRANGSWDDPNPNRGAEGDTDGVVIENEVEKILVVGGKNLSVAENGYYSLYINKAANKAKVVKTGDVEVEPEPVYPEWSIAGSLNSWSSTATPMTLEGDYYVAKNVEFASAGEFKIVNNGTTWYNAEGTFSLGKWGTIIANDGSNISIAAGKYDFYLTGVNLYVVAAGSNAPLAPGVIPAEDGWVYLKPNSNWTQANARFAIYFFGAGETWISMTKIEGTSYYGAKISDMVSKGYTNLIFCRMNPNGTANNWNNKWNQTGDLNISDFTKGNNCFSVSSGSWDGATKAWSHIERLN